MMKFIVQVTWPKRGWQNFHGPLEEQMAGTFTNPFESQIHEGGGVKSTW
tara:strand:+ start:800 stop:946 length:147 start_codon:yes stop_codon:yes gene_type:complete